MIYSKTYWHDRGDSYTSDWHNHYMSKVSQFLQSIDLVKGTIIEYGCYKGEMLDHLAKKYPDCNIVVLITTTLTTIHLLLKQTSKILTVSLI